MPSEYKEQVAYTTVLIALTANYTYLHYISKDIGISLGPRVFETYYLSMSLAQALELALSTFMDALEPFDVEQVAFCLEHI